MLEYCQTKDFKSELCIQYESLHVIHFIGFLIGFSKHVPTHTFSLRFLSFSNLTVFLNSYYVLRRSIVPAIASNFSAMFSAKPRKFFIIKKVIYAIKVITKPRLNLLYPNLPRVRLLKFGVFNKISNQNSSSFSINKSCQWT